MKGCLSNGQGVSHDTFQALYLDSRGHFSPLQHGVWNKCVKVKWHSLFVALLRNQIYGVLRGLDGGRRLEFPLPPPPPLRFFHTNTAVGRSVGPSALLADAMAPSLQSGVYLFSAPLLN